MPRGKALRERHRSLDPFDGKRDIAATAREESARACSHLRRGLSTLGKLQKYPKIHVSTGEESSGSGTDSTQGLRPRHRQEWNPKRPPSTSLGEWPFLRPPELIPEVPVVCQEEAISTGKERNSRVVPPFPESPRCLSPFQGNLFSLHCLDFQAEDRLTPR